MCRTIRFIIPSMLAVSLLAASCGGGGSGAAWCAHLDEIVEDGWDEYDDYGRFSDVSDIDPTDPDRVNDSYDADLTDEELGQLAEAFYDAVQAGRRYDGREAVRAWEESLRDAC